MSRPITPCGVRTYTVVEQSGAEWDGKRYKEKDGTKIVTYLNGEPPSSSTEDSDYDLTSEPEPEDRSEYEDS